VRNDLVVWSEAHQEESSASQTTLDGMRLVCQSIWTSLEGLLPGPHVVDEPSSEEDTEEASLNFFF
jgi:hypothetical protein